MCSLIIPVELSLSSSFQKPKLMSVERTACNSLTAGWPCAPDTPLHTFGGFWEVASWCNCADLELLSWGSTDSACPAFPARICKTWLEYKRISLIYISLSSTLLASQALAVLLMNNTKTPHSSRFSAFYDLPKIQLRKWTFKGESMSSVNYSFF